MGIPNQHILRERLDIINSEFEEKYKRPIAFSKHNPKKASELFEYFVLYNAVLAFNPDAIVEISLRHRGGPTYLPFPAIKYWKTISKIGNALKPSIIVRKNDKIVNFWFDKPLDFTKGEASSIRPDILIRLGDFKVETEGDSIVRLLSNGGKVVEAGILAASQHLKQEDGWKTIEGPDFEGKKAYFSSKDEFLKPPLVIECKSFGAVLGNIEKYAAYGKTIVVVSPEKLYAPKAENVHILRLDKQLDNLEIREKLVPFSNEVK